MGVAGGSSRTRAGDLPHTKCRASGVDRHEERLKECVGVGQGEEVASGNNDRIDADTLAQQPPLKFQGKEAVVASDDRRSGDVGPTLDVATLAEGNLGFIPRVAQYRSGLFGRKVVEKIGLKVEVGVISASLSASDPSADCTGGRPPVSGRLTGRRHHCVHQNEPANWGPIARHHGTETAHRLRHHHRLNTGLDRIDYQRGVLRKSRPWVRARKVNRKGVMTSVFESSGHAAPIGRGYATRTRYKDEVRRDPSSALRPEASRGSSSISVCSSGAAGAPSRDETILNTDPSAKTHPDQRKGTRRGSSLRSIANPKERTARKWARAILETR